MRQTLTMRALGVGLAVVVSFGVGIAPARAQNDVGAPQRYGDAGTHHVGVSLALGRNNGFVWAAGAEYGYFVVNGVAPTVEVTESGGAEVLSVARMMAAVRLLPWRSGSVWPLLVPRVGRLFIENLPDVWGAGGTVGVIVGLSGRVALQVSYEYLRLFPSGDCESLSIGCSVQRGGLGVVIGF